MYVRAGLPTAAALCIALINVTVAFDDEPRSEAAQADLELLQGKWETTLRSSIGPIRNVQTIKDNTSTVDRFDEGGELLHSHTAQYKLRVTDQVKVFTFFDLEVTAGPQKGLKFKGPLSFIYALNQDSWVEARGLLANQKDGEPRLLSWKRVMERQAVLSGRN